MKNAVTFAIACEQEPVLELIINDLVLLIRRMVGHFGIDGEVDFGLCADGYAIWAEWSGPISLESLTECYLSDIREMARAAGKRFDYIYQ